MSYRALPLVALVPVLALGSIAAHAQLVNSGSFAGHHYEVYKANGIAWTAARDAALALTHEGVPGHLATITTAEEDAFLDALRHASLTLGLSQSQVWVGGFQESCDGEPFCGWTWVNGEGPFPGNNLGPVYANWAGGEPNDVGGIEHHLTLGRFELHGWNDEGSAPGTIGGYIVEYATPIPVTDCTDPDGCETFPGQTLIVPPGSIVPPGATFGVQAIEVRDDVARCLAGEQLVLFDSDLGPAISADALVIPATYCAYRELESGEFVGMPLVAIKITPSAGFFIPQGTVAVIHATDLTPDNYDCELQPPDEDPQHRQVVVWQSTLRANMLENTHGVDELPPFVGDAGDYTIGCDSTRGAVRSGSYFVAGPSIFSGYSFAIDPGSVIDHIVDLTDYKLELLLASVDAAKAAGAIKPLEHAALKVPVLLAIKLFKQGAYRPALLAIGVFNRISLLIRYRTNPPNFNYSGEHQSRGQNIFFTLNEKIIPFVE